MAVRPDTREKYRLEKLSHPIAARFSLEQLVEAHEMVEQATHIGNVVVGIN